VSQTSCQQSTPFYIDDLRGSENPGVHGAILTEALASRFKVHVHVPTDWDLARRLGVPRPAVDAAITLNQHLATGAISWAPYADTLVMPRSFGLATSPRL